MGLPLTRLGDRALIALCTCMGSVCHPFVYYLICVIWLSLSPCTKINQIHVLTNIQCLWESAVRFLLTWFKRSLTPAFHYTPEQQSCWGVYWFHSVCPSIRPSRILCLLCSAYSSGWIHFIFTHLIKQPQKVCRVLSFSQNLKIWNFGNFSKFVTLTSSCLIYLWRSLHSYRVCMMLYPSTVLFPLNNSVWHGLLISEMQDLSSSGLGGRAATLWRM